MLICFVVCVNRCIMSEKSLSNPFAQSTVYFWKLRWDLTNPEPACLNTLVVRNATRGTLKFYLTPTTHVHMHINIYSFYCALLEYLRACYAAGGWPSQLNGFVKSNYRCVVNMCYAFYLLSFNKPNFHYSEHPLVPKCSD